MTNHVDTTVVTPQRRNRKTKDSKYNHNSYIQEIPFIPPVTPECHQNKYVHHNKNNYNTYSIEGDGIHKSSTMSSSASASSSSPSPFSSSPKPKSSPSRFLFASMAVIHQNISDSYSSSLSDVDGLTDDNSLICIGGGGKVEGEEDVGLEVVLNLDQSLSYRDN
jgi:hypothetical protein